MNIKPIKIEADYDQALLEVERLWGSEANTPKGDKLDILITLVEAYERDHYPISPPDPVEAIKFRMDQLGLSRKDLEAYLGSRGRVSEILNYKRDLSITMIRELHSHLDIPLESLVLKSKNVASGARGRVKAGH
jgi:HTH-type transcriptional regulator / antitoxin HigA